MDSHPQIINNSTGSRLSRAIREGQTPRRPGASIFFVYWGQHYKSKAAGRALTLLFSLALGGLVAQETILVAGSPPLTSQMVDQRIAVWEEFLQVRFTDEQKAQLRDDMVDHWRHNDKDEIKGALEDVNLYGKTAQLEAVRQKNLESFVENLRAKKAPEDAILLAVFEAAHPDYKDVMHASGHGDLVGTWTRGDAMAPQRNPYTGALQGISFAESAILKIFSDGRFQYAWVHRHCPNGTICCRETSTMVHGGVSVEGQNLVLNAESGILMNHDPCVPKMNMNQPLQAKRESVGWSLKHDANTNAPVLCLTGEPFQVPGLQPRAVCFSEKHP